MSDYLIKENSFVNISVCHLFDKKFILVTEQEQGHYSHILLHLKILLLAIPVYVRDDHHTSTVSE